LAEIFLGPCPVLENRKLARKTYLMRLEAPAVARRGRPGQFVMVRTGPYPERGGGPLLKRPFSIHRLGPDDEISLLYRVVGVGTDLLALARPGESLELLGPLGRGFDPPDGLKRAYLAAGGVGLAPLLALAENLAGRTDLTLFYGEAAAVDLPPESYLKLFPAEIVLTTEDGTAGEKGLVTRPLAQALVRDPAPIFACGPKAMLAEVSRLARVSGVPAWVSLEARLACGLGACLGCAVQVDKGVYARVCAEGPVFRAEEVQWP